MQVLFVCDKIILRSNKVEGFPFNEKGMPLIQLKHCIRGIPFLFYSTSHST